MELESYLDFIDDDTIRLRGHRIDIAHILDFYHEGYTPEVIALELPTLSIETIYAVFTYYLHNRVTMDAYMERRRATVAQLMADYDAQPPSPAAAKIRALRTRQSRDHAA